METAGISPPSPDPTRIVPAADRMVGSGQIPSAAESCRESRMSVLLSVQGLTKSFGPRPLFADLSLDLRAGERVGLIGPNGAGQIDAAAGCSPAATSPDAGTRSLRRGARVGYLAAGRRLRRPARPPARCVLAALADEPLEEHERETRAAITLTQVGFADPDQPADTLSGGWRKRLALARELVRRARPAAARRADQPPRPARHRLAGAAAAGARRSATSSPPTTGRSCGPSPTRSSRSAASTPAATSAPPAAYDDVRRAARRVPRGPGPAAGGGRQPGPPRDGVARPQGVGPARARRARGSRRPADRREELAELKYRNAAAGAAGIDFVGTGRQTRKLLTATGIAKSLGGRPLFAGLDLILSPGHEARPARPQRQRQEHAAARAGRRSSSRTPARSRGPTGCGS